MSESARGEAAPAQHDQEGGPERRARITAEIMAQTGIDEPMIEHLVRSFYERVQRDPVIGPVFAARISDWEHHIAKLCAFWSSVALMSGRYHGQPMQKHVSLPIDASHFDRWLALFEATATELCPPAAAAHFIERARRIADSLEMGMAMHQGRIHSPRHSVRQAGRR
jgi:hemoglobin